jgi:hypothetical protein
MKAARQQQGVVLFVALIVLIIMTLAGLALLRQMGAGTRSPAHRLQENATSVPTAAPSSPAWLVANYAITATVGRQRLLSSWGSSVDPTTFDWDARRRRSDDQRKPAIRRFIIQRLCRSRKWRLARPDCSDSPSSTRRFAAAPATGTCRATSSRSSHHDPGRRARNTISYTQVLVQ